MSVVSLAREQSLPSWVEADPLRGRAVDALGLQASADRIADEMLPGLSVLTNRARYFAFLAWARKVAGSRADEQRIHRLEVALAVRESHLHAEADDTDERCRFVGSRNLIGRQFSQPPANPRDAYRVPVWRAYRASMRNLGLLDRDDSLTPEGDALARRFTASTRPRDLSGKTMLPESACLSAIRSSEGRVLERALGIWQPGRVADDGTPPARRAALEGELRTAYDGYASASRILSGSLSRILTTYERRRDRAPSRTVRALREAAIWERLSVGLHAIFLVWLANLAKPHTAKHAIAKARGARGSLQGPHAQIEIDEQAAASGLRSIRRALELRDRLAGKDDLPHCDPTAFALGEEVVSARVPVEEILARLADRHAQSKGDDAWLREGHRGLELARDADDKWEIPQRATLHGYRLEAFGSLVADLWTARRNG